jgi:chemotaxis protein MotB
MSGSHADRRRGGGSHVRRRRGDHGGGHDGGGDERWLLTYADMITLLMALFIVMWAISSVNTTKFAELSVSLKQAFNGKLTEGGDNLVMGSTSVMPAQPSLVGDAQGKPTSTDPISIAPPSPSFDPITVDPVAKANAMIESAEAADLENLQRLKKRLDQWAAEHGLKTKVDTTIDERGLVIRVLTDDLLFDSGHAVLKPSALPLLSTIASFVHDTSRVPNDVRVEGNTDNVPISNAEFASNWELSAARATAVLQHLLHTGVAGGRLSATAYGEERPLATNRSAAGRAKNRRVELVVLRRALSGREGATP